MKALPHTNTTCINHISPGLVMNCWAILDTPCNWTVGVGAALLFTITALGWCGVAAPGLLCPVTGEVGRACDRICFNWCTLSCPTLTEVSSGDGLSCGDVWSSAAGFCNTDVEQHDWLGVLTINPVTKVPIKVNYWPKHAFMNTVADWEIK